MSRLLVRLYPAAWRARYGEEFETILAERAMGPFDVADVVLGALDARLHPRVARHAASGKGFSMSLRIGGAAAVIGGVLWPLGFAIASIGDASQGIGFGIHIAGAVALLIALIGLSAFQSRLHPELVWTAFLLPAAGFVAAIVGSAAMATLGDRPLVADWSGWSFWAVGSLATLVGSILFGVASQRVQRVSRTGAMILTLGSLAAVIALVIGTGGLGGPLGGVLALFGLLAFAGGWVAMGIGAIRLAPPAVGPQAA